VSPEKKRHLFLTITVRICDTFSRYSRIFLFRSVDGVAENFKKQGYTVLAANKPGDAMELAIKQGGIRFLITDVIMPVLNGSKWPSPCCRFFTGREHCLKIVTFFL